MMGQLLSTLVTVKRVRVLELLRTHVIAALSQTVFATVRTTVYTWQRKLAERGGDVPPSAKPPGRPPHLTLTQTAQVFRWLNGKAPRPYGFDFGLWTRRLVAALVQERVGVTLGVTAVGRLLAERGITPQQPLRWAYERGPAAVARWERETSPALRRRAQQRGAVICFLDDAGVRSDAPLGQTWAPRGQRPAGNAISAVTPRGAFWY